MITATYTDKQFNSVLEQALKQAEQKYIDGLIDIAKRVVKTAKQNGQYQNRTGNLNSSIGYIVAKGRNILSSSFTKTLNGEKGRSKGFFLAKKLLSDNPGKNIRMIIVVGEHYASILESKGRDVLTGSSLKAVSDLKELLRQVRDGK